MARPQRHLALLPIPAYPQQNNLWIERSQILGAEFKFLEYSWPVGVDNDVTTFDDLEY